MGWVRSRLQPVLSPIRLRLRALFRRSTAERELADELRFHIEMETEKNVREGLDPKKARRRALIAFGGVERHKEGARDARGVRWLEDAVKDVRYAARQLRKRPGFTAVAVVTLALGIGANTAIFSVVKTVLLDPLPYPEADELVTMHRRSVPREWSIHPWVPDSVFLAIKGSGSFEEVAGYYPQPFQVTSGDRPYEIAGARVTANLFRLLEARMALGRDFVEADTRPDAPRTAIISYDLWQRRFGGSPDVIGRTIRATSAGWPSPGGDGELHEIIGVLEPGFRLYAPRAGNPKLWLPHGSENIENLVLTLARLRDGVALRHAQSELDVINSRIPGWLDESRGHFGWVRLKSELVRDDRTALLMLQTAVGVVLLIACVNLANLLLARANARQGVMAIRSALGASRGRLLRQTMTESVMLSVFGGLAALLVMGMGLELLLALAPGDVPRIDDVAIDGSILLITMAVAIATGLLVGAIPAITTVRRSANEVLKEDGSIPARSRKQRRASHALVISEVAMVLVLLAGAGLLARSFVSLSRQDPGFRTEDVLAVSLDIPKHRYGNVAETNTFYIRVLARLRQIPGIESASVSINVPLDRGSVSGYRVEGDSRPQTGDSQYDVISPDYFRLLEIPLLRGRYLKDTDRRGTLPVAVIDAAMARAAWPGQDPIGKRFDDGEGRWLTVVGVVGNIRGMGLAHDPRPGFYIPYRQQLDAPLARWGETVFLIRSERELRGLAAPIRQAIWDIEPRQPVPEIATLQSIVAESVRPHRFRALLLACFAAIALILAIAGIYGVVERLVTQRSHEFGIRMALGARTRDVLRMVVRQGTALAAIGSALGVLAALTVTRVVSSMLPVGAAANRQHPLIPQPPPGMFFGLSTTDALAITTAVVVLLGGVAVMASYVPARRATKVDPMMILNAE